MDNWIDELEIDMNCEALINMTDAEVLATATKKDFEAIERLKERLKKALRILR